VDLVYGTENTNPSEAPCLIAVLYVTLSVVRPYS